MQKQCTKCKDFKDLNLFGNDKRRSNGKRSYCKKCAYARQVPGGPDYEKHLAWCKKYRDTHKEKRKESLRKWQDKNPNYWKEWYIKNTEKIKETAKKWRDKNPNYWKEWKEKRKMLKN